MQKFLQCYKVKIRALSPIYIGSGEKIGKKEYIYMSDEHRVIIPDVYKMYAGISGHEKEFTDFMMESGSEQTTLSEWLEKKNLTKDCEAWKKYEMDAGEAFVDEASPPQKIEAFMKDAYGMPYVPGSSIKGMIRTCLLVWEIQKNPDAFRQICQEIKISSQEWADRRDCMQCMRKKVSELEQQILYTLYRDEKKPQNAVNDCLAGLQVGDSAPIERKQLTLSQKIDYTLDGKEEPLPLLRETLIPGTEISFDISIDTQLCDYDMDDIIEAVQVFQQVCNKYFYECFNRKIEAENAVFLGGGCGFLSKTVLYALFGQEAVYIVDRIFKNTLGQYDVHKHHKDIELKIAPHVCKCTMYKGELYDMGIGQISYEEK